MEETIRSLLEPIADELGLEILKISLGGSGRQQTLRVIVDRAGGVDSTALERVSRGLALQLDAEDVIPGAYMLEVTSPGLDWPLTQETDFVRYNNEWVKVIYVDGSTVEGRNLGPDADAEDEFCFLLGIEGKKPKDNRQERIAMRDVAKVVRAINWKDVSAKK